MRRGAAGSFGNLVLSMGVDKHGAVVSLRGSLLMVVALFSGHCLKDVTLSAIAHAHDRHGNIVAFEPVSADVALPSSAKR